jgi:flagellin-like protein
MAHRRGASEVLGALVLLAIVIAAFGFVVSTFYARTQEQTANIMEEYEKGTMRQGELLTLIYHWEQVNANQTVIRVGLFNAGFYNVSVQDVFISGQQSSDWELADADGNPMSAIAPQQLAILTVTVPYSVPGAGPGGSGYEVFLYGTDKLAYVWEL